MASSQAKFYSVLAAIALAGVALIGYVALRERPSSAADFSEAVLPTSLKVSWSRRRWECRAAHSTRRS